MSSIKVFTYNIRTEALCDGINQFKLRKEYIKAEFPKYEADIIGFQETQPHMKQWLIDTFTDYHVCGMGRGEKLDGESNVVAYKRDKFELISLDTFWLSDTPRLPGTRFSTDQSDCPRICTCMALYHKETGRAFRHYNTHLDHEGKFAQAQGISLILNRIASDYAEWQLPVILTGDFNVKPDSVVYKSVIGFNGCGAPLIDVTENVGPTFHAYRPAEVGIKIDYIFTNLPCDSSKSFTARDEKDGVYLSDHYPTAAFLEL